MSRPSSSVPKRCSADGGLKRLGISCVIGPCVATSGAATTSSRKTARINSPTQNDGYLRTWCRPRARRLWTLIGLTIAEAAVLALITNSRIDEAVEHIDNQIHNNENDGDDQR